MPPGGGAAAASGISVEVSELMVSVHPLQKEGRPQPDAKIVFFWRSIDVNRLSMPLGSRMKFCSAGCITVEV